MQNITEIANSPLFEGIQAENLNSVLECIGYHTGSYNRVRLSFLKKSTSSTLAFLEPVEKLGIAPITGFKRGIERLFTRKRQ